MPDSVQARFRIDDPTVVDCYIVRLSRREQSRDQREKRHLHEDQ
jgi:hypothetical protein